MPVQPIQPVHPVRAARPPLQRWAIPAVRWVPAAFDSPGRWFLPGLVALSTLLRFPGLMAPPSPDEAGFLLVARTWSPSAENMYGTYWVDRPPVLIAAYRLADDVAGAAGPRLLAAVLAGVLLVAVHGLGRRIAGVTAGRVAAGVAAALLANPDLSAWTAKGEILGVPFVALSCLATLAAVSEASPRRSGILAAAAGTSAVLAFGFKQSLLGGFVFAGVLLVASVATRRSRPGDAAHLAGRFLLGAAVPVGLVVAWVVVSPAHLGSASYQVFGFRADAARVLALSDSTAPGERAAGLWRLFVRSGMVVPLVVAAATARRWLPRCGSAGPALLALTATDAFGVVAGGSYWHAYLIPLVPDLALLAACAYAAGRPPRRAAVVTVVTVVAVVVSSAYALVGFAHDRLDGARAVGAWEAGRAIARVAQPEDTITSLYGSADVVLASTLSSPYEHLWTLPMRTLDPRLERLRRILSGPRAPTWLVVVLPMDSWHLDPRGELRDLVSRRYVRMPQRCGPAIWLRRTASVRALPALPCPAPDDVVRVDLARVEALRPNPVA